MVMERTKGLVSMGIEAAREMLPKINQDGGYPDSYLWILAQGFFNGFYTVIDTLKNVEMNQPDPLLKQAIQSWLAETKAERDSRLGKWRNWMTHQGRSLTTQRTVRWETDDWHDTDRPVFDHVFAQVGSGEYVRDVTFERWALDQFLWLDRGVREIEVRYNRLKKAEERRASFSK